MNAGMNMGLYSYGNVFMGQYAGLGGSGQTSRSDYNTLIGYYAGKSLYEAEGNTVIGETL